MDADGKSDLDRIYEGARDLFLRGQHDRALDRFQSIYEVDCTFRDVAEIVNDYYDPTLKEARLRAVCRSIAINTPHREWLAIYSTRFQHTTA